MNERIKELEKQAWDCVDQTWDWANPDNPSKVTLFKTKFAELIVKEFRTLVKETYLKTDPGHRACLLVLDEKIEQHFGVEE